MTFFNFLFVLLAGFALVSSTPLTDDSGASDLDCSTMTFEQKMLLGHNIHRANHSAPDLVWDNSLANDAQILTNSCVFAHQTQIGAANYGQNIAAWGPPGDPSGAINGWYNDEFSNWQWYGQNFDGSLPGNFESYGHFTAVVWKASTHLGCASTTYPPGTIFPGFPDQVVFVACNFYPAENDYQFAAANILPPLGHPYVETVC